MGALDLNVPDEDGIKGEDIAVSLDVEGKPKDGQDTTGGESGVFLKVEGKGDWDRASYWRGAFRAVKRFITGG